MRDEGRGMKRVVAADGAGGDGGYQTRVQSTDFSRVVEPRKEPD
jgi:hypothetical protein